MSAKLKKRFSICYASPKTKAEFSVTGNELSISSRGRKFLGLFPDGDIKRHTSDLRQIEDIRIEEKVSFGQKIAGAALTVVSLAFITATAVRIILYIDVGSLINNLIDLYSSMTSGYSSYGYSSGTSSLGSSLTQNSVSSSVGSACMFSVLLIVILLALAIFGTALCAASKKVSFVYNEGSAENRIAVCGSELARLEQYAEALEDAVEKAKAESASETKTESQTVAEQK